MDEADHKERARALFGGLAERHGLTIEWPEELDVGLQCKFPKQDKLDFEIFMELWGDELFLVHDWFYVDLFPADQERVWTNFERFADGLLSGEARAVIKHCGNPKRSYLTLAEICEDRRWRSISTGIAPHRWRPWGRKTEIV